MANNDNSELIKTIPTAKRNPVLLKLHEQLNGMKLDKSISVAGTDFYMTTLTSDESVWADSHTNMNTEISFLSSQRVPRLAASIKRINGKPVEELFEFPDDMSEEDRKYHSQNQYRKRYWVMSQMLSFLSEQSDPFIMDLWEHYATLIKDRDESWDNLKKSLAGISGGELKVMSSPEKGSSQVTQM
jgi:hypothetical protein